MGKFTDEVATRYCSTCQKTTLHQIIVERKVSTTKVVGGLLTNGLSLLATGIKSDQKSYMCHQCHNVS